MLQQVVHMITTLISRVKLNMLTEITRNYETDCDLDRHKYLINFIRNIKSRRIK
jgi:hypothetical protein